MIESVEEVLNRLKDKICSFAYTIENTCPVVCQMGFVLFENKIVFHTNTWTQKWQMLKENQKVAICIGHDHLTDYAQIEGVLQKIPDTNIEFEKLEAVYFAKHPDSVIYKEKGNTGLLIVTPKKIKYGQVVKGQVSFFEYEY